MSISIIQLSVIVFFIGLCGVVLLKGNFLVILMSLGAHFVKCKYFNDIFFGAFR